MGQNRCRRVSRGPAGGPKVRSHFFGPFFHGFVIFQCSSGDVLRSCDFRGSKNGPKMDHFVGGSLTIVLLPCSVNLDFRGPKNRKVDFWAKKFNMVSRSSTLTRPCTRARVCVCACASARGHARLCAFAQAHGSERAYGRAGRTCIRAPVSRHVCAAWQCGRFFRGRAFCQCVCTQARAQCVRARVRVCLHV